MKLRWTPRERCTPEQSMHRKTPYVMLAQLGFLAPQSKQAWAEKEMSERSGASSRGRALTTQEEKPAPAPPRPSPRSDSAGPGPLCVTASLVSASDWTAVFTSLSDKVGSVWVPVSVSVRTCVSAHLVSFSALSDAFLSLRLSTRSVCLPGSCLGLLSGTASASLA